MAVAVVMDFEGATLDQYDQVLAGMGLTPRGAGPPGALFHWVTETDGGVRVTDVWESREQFDRFAEEQIGPRSAEVGMSPPSNVAFHDVHNHLTGG
jgi:hypothetical protein